MFLSSTKSTKREKLRKIFSYFVGSFCLSLILFLAGLYIYNTFFKVNKQYDGLIANISQRYDLDPMLVKALIWRESRFNPNAIGSKGEIGLMQLMEKSSVKDWVNHTKRKIKYKGVLFNPELNIEIGTWYLARSKKHWRGYRDCNALALAEYNAGYSNVKRWIPKNFQGEIIEFIKFPSTKQYVKSILEQYKAYKKVESRK